jgi:hypothetical protein
LSEKGHMGLGVTGHQPVFEIPGVAETTPLNETDKNELPETLQEPLDNTQEDSYK